MVFQVRGKLCGLAFVFCQPVQSGRVELDHHFLIVLYLDSNFRGAFIPVPHRSQSLPEELS
jgi:hypothetical protein